MATSGKLELYFGATNGKTYSFSPSIFTDAGTAISCRIKTKEYYLSGPDRLDEIQYVYAYADEPQATVVSLSVDGANYEVIGSLQDYLEPQRFDVWEKGYHFSLGLDEVSSNNIKVKGFNLIYEQQPETL